MAAPDWVDFTRQQDSAKVELAAMSSCAEAVGAGQTLVMARNAPRAAFSGLVLSGAMPAYVEPEYDHRWQVAHGVDPRKLDRVLGEHPEAVAAMVCSPTDYGVSADVSGLADVAHAHDVPLLTDGPWGADGGRLLGDAIALAVLVRAAVAEIPGLTIMGEEILASPGAMALDLTHLTIDVIGLGLTGHQAADWLSANRGVHVGSADHRRVMALITLADTNETVQRLVDALDALSDSHSQGSPLDLSGFPTLTELRTETVMLPRDAVLGRTETVGWRDAVGRVSAEMVCPHPPGIPVIAPGELITEATMDYLQCQAAAGARVEGTADESMAHFLVALTTGCGR